jgi:hypothetical protein
MAVLAQDPPNGQSGGTNGKASQPPASKPQDKPGEPNPQAPDPKTKPGDEPKRTPDPKTKPGDEPKGKPDDKAKSPDDNPKAKADPRSAPLTPETMRGLPRNAPDIFQVKERLPYQTPTQAELRLYDEVLHKGAKNDTEKSLVQKVHRYRILRLTDPANHARIGLAREELSKDIDNCRRIQPQMYQGYLDELLKSTPALMENHIAVRINAMYVLARQRYEPAVPLMVAQIQNPKQHEAVQYWCVKGIQYLGDQEIKNKSYENDAVNALLNMLKRNHVVHPFTRHTIVTALGAVGRPMRSAVNRDAEVAQTLILMLRDPTVERLTRAEAIRALARMRVPPDLDYNFQLVGYEIARFAADASYAAMADPGEDLLRTYLYMYECYDALMLAGGDSASKDAGKKVGQAGSHPLAKTKGDGTYAAALRDRVKELTRVFVEVYKPPPDQKLPEGQAQKVAEVAKRLPQHGADRLTDELVTFLKSHPPRDQKLTPIMQPLPPAVEPKPRPKPAPPAEKSAAEGEKDAEAPTNG